MKTLFKKLLKEMPLVGIFRGIQPEESESIVSVAIEAGIRIVEVPLNSPDPYRSIALLANRFHDNVLVGAGTVTSIEEVHAVAKAGGQIIVMPYAISEVVNEASKLGLVTIPGSVTPTEIRNMVVAGADAVKIFPAEMVSPKVVKSMCAILPSSLPLLPVGGINESNMKEYIDAGATGFGLGSSLYKVGDSAEVVSEKAKIAVEFMKKILISK